MMKKEETLKAEIKDAMWDLGILEKRKDRAKEDVDGHTQELLACHGHVPLDEDQSGKITNMLVASLRRLDGLKDDIKSQKKTLKALENEMAELRGGPLDSYP